MRLDAAKRGVIGAAVRPGEGFVLGSKVVGTDDTPVKVLDRQLPHTRKGRFWPYVGDRDHPAVIYDYTPTRERAGPGRCLKRYLGHLQADAYVAYDSFFINPGRGLVKVGCGAHARRHVYQARDTDLARFGCSAGLHCPVVRGGETLYSGMNRKPLMLGCLPPLREPRRHP